MRHLLYSLVLTLLLCSCNKSNEGLLFEMKYQNSFDVQAGLSTLQTHSFFIHDLPTGYTNYLNANNFTKSQVKAIQPVRMNLTAPLDNIDFAFLRHVSVWIFDPNDINNRAEIFFRDNVPITKQSDLQMLAGISDVKEIMENETFSLEVRFIRPKTSLLKQFDCFFDMDFEVIK